ncbi:MAG: zeta toxin family protein, partial [Chitinophagaceae bacterium]|nr:zeta toxin family protein [Chitinophagaceae bacterium]
FTVFPELLNIREFVNADEIARGLSPFQPESVAIQAGKIMLKRLDELIAEGKDFAFETTLSTRSFIILCEEARSKGYDVYMIFLWLPSPEQAIDRVKERVSTGGHHIPDDVVVRRYQAGLKNFTTLYQPLMDYWIFLDNSSRQFQLIAEGGREPNTIIHNKTIWQKIQESGSRMKR